MTARRITYQTAAALAADLRTSGPLAQVRQVGRIVQEMLDPDVARVVRALARQAAQELDMPDGYIAAAAVSAGPGWWASVLAAEAVNGGAARTGTLMALFDQPSDVVGTVMLHLLSPAGLVRGVRL